MGKETMAAGFLTNARNATFFLGGRQFRKDRY